jgi:hypothetical protein
MAYKIKGHVLVSGSSLQVNGVEVVKETTTQTLTNKTIDADLNTLSNIDNADIKAGAAIDATKIADGSVSNTEFQYLGGVTSDIQDQLDDKLDGALLEEHVLVGNASDLAVAVDTAAVGDILVTAAGGLTIKNEVVVNADISTSAAIALSKLAALTVDRALVSNGSGVIDVSATTATEVGYLSGVTSSVQDQLDAKLDLAGGVMTGDIDMGGNKVTDLDAPTDANDAATKAYVDAVAEGLKPKAAVRVATTAAGTLASDFENGDTVDGVTLATGDRLLIKDQAAQAENGIYVVQASGAPVRASDFDSLSPIDEINGAMVAVQEGTANAGKLFVQTGEVTAIGTDPIVFIFFNSVSSLVGGDGITVSGSNISVDHDGEGLTFVANALALELDGSTLAKSSAGLKVADGGIADSQIDASANIARSKLDSGTNHAIVINNGSGVMSDVALSDGQVLIGDTAGAAVAATLTAGAGIDITSAAGSITIAATGGGSPGDIDETEFEGVNDQDTPANVTGFAFANGVVRAFEALVSIEVDATADLYEVRTLRGVQKAGSWDMSETSNGDDSLVELTITTAGQVQYTSADYPGFVSLDIKFRAISVSV